MNIARIGSMVGFILLYIIIWQLISFEFSVISALGTIVGSQSYEEGKKRNYVDGDGYCGLHKSKIHDSNYCQEKNSNVYLSNNINLSSDPSTSNLSQIEKQIIRNYVIDLLGNDPKNCFKDIIHDDRFGSLRKLSKRLGISRPTLRAYISIWLEI